MITSTLPYIEGSDENRKLRRLALANKIQVTPKYSIEGRGYDASVYIDYSFKDGFALSMIECILNTSDNVYCYSVYDENGNRVTGFDKNNFKKRI